MTEATLMNGKGVLTLTGKLGDVMQESAQAAMSYVRSNSEIFGLAADFNKRTDIHIHVPEGAIPKDGPSAGITIATAMISALVKVPIRKDVAMTGEITLRGKVLPIGGLKEKLLAAHRAGIGTIIVPKDNEKDLADVPKNVLDQLKIYMVEGMDEVLKQALAGADPAGRGRRAPSRRRPMRPTRPTTRSDGSTRARDSGACTESYPGRADERARSQRRVRHQRGRRPGGAASMPPTWRWSAGRTSASPR